jgi:carbon-monoxide dehydrogenase medium subunit
LQVPAPFEYERATSVDHALSLLAQLGPDARILAGGYSLLPMMKLRLAQPAFLVDIDALAEELGYIEQRGAEIRIGAMTRHRDLLNSPLLADLAPIFVDAERVIADPIVRNRGTIGGALCQADPSEDLSAVCAAIHAQLVIRGVNSERRLDMRDFYRGPYRTAVGHDEMLTEIRIPMRECAGSAYEKVHRRVGDWAVVATGVTVELEPDLKRIARAGIALVAVGGELTSLAAEQVVVGAVPSEELFDEAGRAAAEACSPVTDQRGSAEYKRHAARVLVGRALERAVTRAQERAR